ncbi:hypothetical protein [Photobacterium halotolerans]|uniref:hypothetical protein n=1 Tax=Photobacterium halotolerans TaxID=265726 RepID=UPI001372E2A5|nr:hypothetical protein [Photobacterium halotolerans]NAW85689.1 hypothetical protein [Photobacterium halotolerans]
MSRLSSVLLWALCDERQTLFVGPKSAQKSPFDSLLWAGTVVGAPGTDNLKIRPEFFPMEVDYVNVAQTINKRFQVKLKVCRA